MQYDHVLCLFSGDGQLQEEEIEAVMRACIHESGMELPESDIQALASALYEEAGGGYTNGNIGGDITLDQLKEVFAKHPGLMQNLTFR